MTLAEITQWLDSRGGRTLNDLCDDGFGYYVWMMGRDGHQTKAYITQYVTPAKPPPHKKTGPSKTERTKRMMATLRAEGKRGYPHPSK